MNRWTSLTIVGVAAVVVAGFLSMAGVVPAKQPVRSTKRKADKVQIVKETEVRSVTKEIRMRK